MINGRMRTYTVNKPTNEIDEYGQKSLSFGQVDLIQASITTISQKVNEKDIRYVDSTHMALTLCKTIESGMRLTCINGLSTYEVKYVNNDGRMAQLILTEVI